MFYEELFIQDLFNVHGIVGCFFSSLIENVCAEELGGEKKETKGCGEVWSEDYVEWLDT